MPSSGEPSPLPSPESNQASTTPTSIKSSNKPDVALVVRKQPPTFVFSDEWFYVEFGLEFSKQSGSHVADAALTAGAGADAEFGFDLVPVSTTPTAVVITKRGTSSDRLQQQDEVGLLVVEPASIWFSLRGSPPRWKQRVRCRIRNQRHGRNKLVSYYIRLFPLAKLSNSGFPDLDHVMTSQITLVNHKIRVDTESEWESVWYKDEGGRDKSMMIVASLVDQNGELRTGEQVPLQLGLYYNNDEHSPLKVIKQDILRTMGASKPRIDETTGKATVRFRIEDVSKNHQGQDFKIEVSVPPKGFKDVAPGFSPAVNVRSKRNKRPRNIANTGRPDLHIASPDVRPTGYDETAGSDSSFAAADLPRLREALQGVIRWTEEVVTGIVSLQWQIIGYHQHPDGSPDYNRPYHNIPNPEAFVSRIMGMYAESTREQLMTLLHVIDRGSQEHYSTMNLPPSIPRPTEDDEGYHMSHRNVQGQSIGRVPYTTLPGGMHLSMTQEGSRDKADMRRPEMLHYPHHSMPTYSHGMRPRLPQSLPPSGGMHPSSMHPDPIHPMVVPNMMQNNASQSLFREAEVAYVLAKQFKAIRSGERLGFPAYSISKELLGFYRESNVGVPQFVPIQRHAAEFGPMEIMDAVHILQAAIRSKSKAVHALKDWGSMASLLDHALVYDWTKDIASGGGGSGHVQSRASTPSD